MAGASFAIARTGRNFLVIYVLGLVLVFWYLQSYASHPEAG